jgi:hypothetical protein
MTKLAVEAKSNEVQFMIIFSQIYQLSLHRQGKILQFGRVSQESKGRKRPKTTPILIVNHVPRGVQGVKLRFEQTFPRTRLYRTTIENTGMEVTSTETGKTTLITTERTFNTTPLSVELIVASIFEEVSI